MLLFNIFTTENSFVGMLLMICAYISALLLAMAFHEFAHAHAAFKEGDLTAKSVGRYTLAPFSHVDIRGIFFLVLFGYGWAKPVPVDSRNFRRGKLSALRVYSAGVLTNILVGVISAVIYAALYVFLPEAFTFGIYGQAVMQFLQYMIMINFIFGFFNLLPFYSFDGYRIIETFTKPYSKFIDFMRRYSFIILLLCIFTGIISLFVEWVPLSLAQFLLDGLIKLFTLFLG
ncbi:MAG: site-2 protease family protein [Clostridia bacterium]|nr:site-2 protease family protein [Clostridia bacterium]